MEGRWKTPPPPPVLHQPKKLGANRVKANNPSDRDHSLFKGTAEATGSSLSTVRRIVQQKDGLKTPGKKRPNRKEEFSKLDEFDLGVIRRIVHGYYARNETFSLKKLQKQLKEEIAFPYSISTLGFVLKSLTFVLRDDSGNPSFTKDQI